MDGYSPSVTFSPAAKSTGASDGRRDSREDIRSDQISAYIMDEDELEFDVDPWDALDAQAHRKKMAVWSLSSRRRVERAKAVQEERPSLTTLDMDALLMRTVVSNEP